MTKCYGKTINVNIEIKKTDNRIGMTRTVKEDMSLKDNTIEAGKKKLSSSKDGDHVLENLDMQLKNLEKDFSKTSAEIAEIFCKVSGNVGKMR